MNPYPGDRSVLLLDGAIQHYGQAVTDAVQDVGGRVEYLPPYNPEHMPIEFGFRAVNGRLRLDREKYSVQHLEDCIRAAVRSVGPEAGRNAFHESGWIP